MFISDTGNNRLIRLSDGVATVVDMSAVGGLLEPWHVIEGESSSVYIADFGNDRIVHWRDGVAQVFPIDGLAPPLDSPTGLTGDDFGGYVTERTIGRLLHIVENSPPDRIDPGVLDPPPVGFTDVAMDRHSRDVFVTDAEFSRLLMFPDGLGPAIRVDLFRDLNPADLSEPQGLDVTDKGDVIIADTGHDRILVIPGIRDSGSPTIFATPTPLIFGQTPVGENVQMTLTIHNPNDRPVYVSGVGVFFGDGSFSTGQEPFTIGPFSNRQQMVTFAPQTPGEKFATLVIWHDAGDSLVVPLIGFGGEQPFIATLKLVAGYAAGSPSGFTAPNFGAPGEQVDLRFSLLNPTGRSVGGLQFTFQLENAGDSDKLYLVEIAPSDALLAQGFTLYTNSNLKAVNAVGDTVPAARIVVAPQLFDGVNGGILPAGNIHLGNVIFQILGGQDGPPDLSLLGQTIQLRLSGDQVVSDEFGEAIPTQPNDRDAAVHIGIRGDVSLDGRVDIRDAVLEVRVILGYPIPSGGDYQYHLPISTAFIIADMQPDGAINVLDIIAQINHILGIQGPPVGPKPIAGATARPAEINLGTVTARPNGQTAIPVMLDTDQPLAGAEFTFTFDPSELWVGAPELAAPSSGLALDYRIADGSLKIVVYSMQAVGGLTSGPVAWLPVKPRDGATAPTLELTEAILGTRNAEPVEALIVTASQSVGHKASTPDAFALRGARPNPFNPSTEISYEVPQQAHISLIVYNVLGQEVVRLVDQVQPAGRYTAIWDARNRQGQAVSSGIYVCRLTTSAGYTESRRMTLMK